MTDSASPTPLREEWLEFLERHEERTLKTVSHVLLMFALTADVLVRGGFTRTARIDIALAAGAAIWMLPVALGRASSCGSRVRGVHFAGLVALMAALVVRSPVFGFWTFSGYFWVFIDLEGRWQPVGVLAIAAVDAISQSGGAPKLTAGGLGVFAGVFVLNAVVASAVIWFTAFGEERSERRAQAIDELTEANRRLEETLAENAALQAQLLTQAREAGVAEERRRMAREIHDTLAQGLTGIITQLQAAGEKRDKIAHTRHVQAAIDLARESLSEARRSVQALAPAPLVDARLPEALRDVADRFSTLHGIETTVTVTGGARPIAPELDVALLRTAQEALANVAKHAGATRVGLTLSYMEDQVTLDVRDDGVGFAPARPVPASERIGRDGGFGLAAMEQRLNGVAGRLEIESEPDGGTAISASVPLLATGEER